MRGRDTEERQKSRERKRERKKRELGTVHLLKRKCIAYLTFCSVGCFTVSSLRDLA